MECGTFIFNRLCKGGKGGVPLFADTLEIFPCGIVGAVDVENADIAFFGADTEVIDPVSVVIRNLLNGVFVVA